MKPNQRFYQAADDRQARQFCPNCGQPVNPGAAFCGHCGAQLSATTEPQSTAATDSSSSASQGTAQATTTVGQRQTQTPQRRRMPKWLVALLAVLVVALVAAYLVGRNYFAPAKQLERDITAIQSHQKGVAKQFTSSDPSLKITSKTINPLLTHFDNNKQALARFRSQLKSQKFTNDGLFEFKKTGKQWLLFDQYKIQVKPVYASLTTNHDDVQLKVNGKRVATSNSDDYSFKAGPLVPGDYQLSAVGTVSDTELKNTNTYYLNGKQSSYDLSLRTISFNVVGTPGTNVYLNNKSFGTIGDDGNLAIEDAAWSSDLELVGKYPVKKTMVKSQPVKITEDDADTDVNLTFDGVMSEDDAGTYLDDMFSAISDYTSSGEIADATDSDGKDLDEYFANGTANKDYQEFITMAKGYYKNEDVLNVMYTPSVVSIAPGEDNQCELTYDVKYEFVNSEDERTQIFRYTATVKKSGDNYQIVSISPAEKISATTETDDEDD